MRTLAGGRCDKSGDRDLTNAREYSKMCMIAGLRCKL